MYELLKKGDMGTLKSNLVGEFIGIYETGIHDWSEEVKNLENLSLRSYELTNINVRQPSENVAIIAY